MKETQRGHFEWGFGDLPGKALDAHRAFFDRHLDPVRKALEEPRCQSFTIALAPANHEHDAWRSALAADLAREYAPKLVNVAAGPKTRAFDELLEYLEDAPGVTGQYLQAHE